LLSRTERSMLQSMLDTGIGQNGYLTYIARLKEKIPQLLIDTIIILRFAREFPELVETIGTCQSYVVDIYIQADILLRELKPPELSP
jgi:hypothetical protein